MTPNLATYDVILVNSSAGKDSQAMLDYVHQLAEAAGVANRMIVVHADLGRVEWQGTKELAARQAAHYGIRFEVVKRTIGDLLQQIEARGMWPSSKARYCTSDHKRAQVHKLITKLSLEVIGSGKVRILNCMGLRADESKARGKKQPLTTDASLTTRKRTVDVWLPIHDWTVAQVWDRINASGVEHHTAYDKGMKRLSCCFCVFAPKSALLIAGKHNPELLDTYVKLEVRMGHKFRQDMAIADVQNELLAT